jgi:hypothetical protein
VTTKKMKNIIFCTFGTLIAILMCTFTHMKNASAVQADVIDSNAILEMAKEQGVVFMVGDSEMSKDVSVSELVQKYQAYRDSLLSTPIRLYARNNEEMKPTEENINELRNQFTFCDGQNITVHTDIISGETRVVLERHEGMGRVTYLMYSFNAIKNPQEEVEANNRIVTFNYLGFRYYIFIENDEFNITCIWDPEPGTKVYDVNDINVNGNSVEFDTLKRKLIQAFTEGTEITFIEENVCCVRIHAFVNYHGVKEEYVFDTYNAKPLDGNVEFFATVKTLDDEYGVYIKDRCICLDSAKHSGYTDNPFGVRMS